MPPLLQTKSTNADISVGVPQIYAYLFALPALQEAFNSKDPATYGVAQQLFGSPLFWLQLIAVTTVCVGTRSDFLSTFYYTQYILLLASTQGKTTVQFLVDQILKAKILVKFILAYLHTY